MSGDLVLKKRLRFDEKEGEIDSSPRKRVRFAGYLPEEIVSDILLTLRAEDVQSFKFVSKFWYSFISQPTFVNLHFNLNRSHSEEQIMFTTITKPTPLTNNKYVHRHFSIADNKMSEPQIPNLSEGPLPNSLCLQAACDGLVLYQDKYSPRHLCICNPVTSSFTPLPPPIDSFSKCFHWALFRDPTTVNTYNVLGIVNNDTFILLTVGNRKKVCADDWELYKHDDPGSDFPLPAVSQPFVVGSEVHWVSINPDGILTPRGYKRYYCFNTINFSTRCMTKALLPATLARPCDLREFNRNRCCHLISETKDGFLCVTIATPYQLDTFLLQDRSRDLWVTTGCITLQSLFNRPYFLGSFLQQNTCLVSVKSANKDNALDWVKIVIHEDDRLLLFDLSSHKCNQIGFLSKNQKLTKHYFFHSSTLVGLD